MNVYKALIGVEYEAPTELGVFSSFDGALEALYTDISTNMGYVDGEQAYGLNEGYHYDYYGDYFAIESHQVDVVGKTPFVYSVNVEEVEEAYSKEFSLDDLRKLISAGS